ncbi:MAG: nucleoside deaminase [Deltaproteobacteria bacterium]|nr:nucleoside deaminase [Deltaproteobacteria bacterium]
MALALAEARAAAEAGDVPVGAVVLHGGEIVGRGRNRREALRDPTWHAEVEAIRAASSRLGRWRLTGCTLLVTLEPCPMCAYALVLARVDRVAWAATDPRFGGAGSLHALLRDPRHNHRPAVTTGLLAEECSDLLKDFFRARRA